MLPSEKENREEIGSRFEEDLNIADSLLTLSASILDKLSKTKSPHIDVDGHRVVLALAVSATRKYQAVIELCKIGSFENADIIGRSLFEALLAERFIIGNPIEETSCSDKLKKALSKSYVD